MAGGSGERFWPVSTRENPKQFLKLASPELTLLEQSVARAASCVGLTNAHIATSKILADKSLATCPSLSPNQVLAEPFKKNTAGCLVWVAANIMARYQDWATVTVAVLTADQRIEPEEKFVETVGVAMDTAEQTGALVTIGIRPDRPETGFGYIEVGEQDGEAYRVVQFREKPDAATAEEYLASGRFLWNSGMFFFTMPTLMAEFEQARPEMAQIIRTIAGHLSQGDVAAAEATFEQLEGISFDFAVMEKAKKVMVVEARFSWDDLGSWDSVERAGGGDAAGNVAVGLMRGLDSSRNVVYSTGGQEVCLLGVNDLVVVVHDGKVLVCAKDRAQDVKKFVQ